MSDRLLTVEQALTRLLDIAEAARSDESEWLSLADADGRVLAEPLIAPLDSPPWANSAMDGYALRLSDWQGEPLPVSQRVLAGSAPLPLASGTCARIFTGAPLPVGADCVEMQENVSLSDDARVLFHEPMRLGQHIRPRAQESRQGDILLAAGTRLGPLELGLAATQGISRLRVSRKPRVAVLSTGDELVEPGQVLGAAQIYNSNRYLLSAWLPRLGCEVIDAGIIADDLQATRSALQSLRHVDLILCTGGVSVGEADCLGAVLRESGKLALWKLAIKPGKPLTIGHCQGQLVIGLPGNPASTLVTFALLVRPYLLRLQGVQRIQPLGFEVRAGFTWHKAGTRREYLRARIDAGRVLPYANQSPGVLRSAAWADGLAEVLEGRTLQEGDWLRFIPWSELLV
jgi:molybdopterin molybdotransferase